jgi:hypothetical protein
MSHNTTRFGAYLKKALALALEDEDKKTDNGEFLRRPS